MEFHPPLEERSDKELFDIISNKDKWAEEIQLLAFRKTYREISSSISRCHLFFLELLHFRQLIIFLNKK